MHDGSQLFLRKVAEDYNPSDKMAATRLLHETGSARPSSRPVFSTSSRTRRISSTSSTWRRAPAFLRLSGPGHPSLLDQIMDGLR